MNNFQEASVLVNFSLGEQRSIVEEIYEKYNTSHPAGVRAALDNAAWLGFIAGLEALKNLQEKEI